MRTPMGIITRNAMPISRAWVLTFFSYSVRDMVSREVSRRVVGTEERARHRVYYEGMINIGFRSDPQYFNPAGLSLSAQP